MIAPEKIEVLFQEIAASYENFQNRYVSSVARTEIQARMYDDFVRGFRFTEGAKYIKIITGGSVWGFINKSNPKFREGDILKAASWNAPALNFARGNVNDGGYEIRWTGA